VLRRDSERIRLAEVYREVVFDPAAVAGEERDRSLEALVRAVGALAERELDVTLASIFEPGGARSLRAVERAG
jgi:hypothetical protein